MAQIKHKFRSKILNFLRDLLEVNPIRDKPNQESKKSVHLIEPGIVMDNQLLAGRNALVTGAGQNIGRGIVLEMAKQGANVYFTDLYQERCNALTKDLNAYPIISRGFASDVSKTEDSDALINHLQKEKILIDILVNNAGISNKITSLESLDLDNWRPIFETNLFGPIHLTKSIAQKMIEHKTSGSIIFISSVHQDILFNIPNYSASKAALGMVIKELAFMLAPNKIRVNGIAPGWILEDEQGNPLPHPNSPLQSTINPCYIGRAAVYLASDYFSKFTTGTVLKIDAGVSLHGFKSLE